MVEIDGAVGEGGGQMLRTGLTLAMATGQPVRWINIRAGRDKPGLRPQHLQCVQAAAKICGATLTRVEVGSAELTFEPGPVVPGDYRFEIGTAGNVGLVLHTVHAALALAGKPSTVAIRGGTHVDFAPTVDYLQEAWAPAMAACGYGVRLRVETLGFYPKGGGWLHAEIDPWQAPGGPLAWRERPPLEEVRIRIALSNLTAGLAHRMENAARAALGKIVAPEVAIPPAEVFQGEKPGPGAGIALALACRLGPHRACFQALGKFGLPSEQVAAAAAAELSAFLDGDAPIDEHLADQLLLPLAAAGLRAEFRTCKATQHLLTNAEVVGKFLKPPRIVGALGQPALALVNG